MIKTTDKFFDDAVKQISEKTGDILLRIDEDIKRSTYEIRLRADRPVILFGSFGSSFVSKDSKVFLHENYPTLTVDKNDINDTLSIMCGYSVYSHQDEIAKGFVTLKNGCRVGLSGENVSNGGGFSSMKNISGINLRIARECPNASHSLIESLYMRGNVPSVIVCGPPCSGKTTILKDFAKQISTRPDLGLKKTVVIDERFEMSDCRGINCDVLSGFDKSEAINRAVRSLSPQIVVCDEIVDWQEAENVVRGLNCGVAFLVSVHADSREEFARRKISQRLLSCGQFDRVVFLRGEKEPGIIDAIVRTDELTDENSGVFFNSGKLVYSGVFGDI